MTKEKIHIEVQAIDKIQKMCEESLSPDTYDEWLTVKEWLFKTRHLHHAHEAGTGKHIDTCGKCGMDLRNEIHINS